MMPSNKPPYQQFSALSDDPRHPEPQITPGTTVAVARRRAQTNRTIDVRLPPSTPLQGALDANFGRGGHVLLGPHTYYVAGTITVPVGMALVGVPGKSSIILVGDYGPVLKIENGAVLADIHVDLQLVTVAGYVRDTDQLDGSPTGDVTNNSVIYVAGDGGVLRNVSVPERARRCLLVGGHNVTVIGGTFESDQAGTNAAIYFEDASDRCAVVGADCTNWSLSGISYKAGTKHALGETDTWGASTSADSHANIATVYKRP